MRESWQERPTNCSRVAKAANGNRRPQPSTLLQTSSVLSYHCVFDLGNLAFKNLKDLYTRNILVHLQLHCEIKN